ncbi:MAG: hypothetical protein OQK82_03650 [Candidatus Pacearchaeota archaeon]|nr:hypothetical protein [Candidatus Pacearchaeota archaeon]
MNNTKAKINITEGIIELEGNEEFVSKYLDEFKDKIIEKDKKAPIEYTPTKNQKNMKSEEVINKNSKIKIPRKIELEPFEITGNQEKSIPSLSAFFDEKQPGNSNAKRIVTLGYYISEYLGKPNFSEGNIEYGFKALNLSKKPAHMHQIIINQKNEKGWFEEGDSSNSWRLTKLGEIFVEEKLPENKEK